MDVSKTEKKQLQAFVFYSKENAKHVPSSRVVVSYTFKEAVSVLRNSNLIIPDEWILDEPLLGRPIINGMIIST